MKLSDDKRELYEKSRIDDDGIKIAASSPELKNKIRSNIGKAGDDEEVFWYIKFNMALNGATVNRRTMNVTETNGYIVGTQISYDGEKHLISICPVDSYAQNEYYILNISKKVESEAGRKMKRPVHLMFKLTGGRITEMKILSAKTEVPKSVKRPRGYVPQGDVVFPKSSMARFAALSGSGQSQLPFQPFFINPILTVLGMGVAIYGALANVGLAATIGLAAAGLGVAHIAWQLSRRKLRSKLLYNVGAALFNSGSYARAKSVFERAFNADHENEYAEYGAAKVEFFL